MRSEQRGGTALAAGGLAALLASACCLGPLVLITLGISGAWIANLSLLEPYRPLFLAVAALAMLLAWRRIYRPAVACAPGQACAVPALRRTQRVLFWGVAALIGIAFAFPYAMPFFY